MLHRPRTLVALSLLGALGFVVFRVFYRVVFGAAGSGSEVLWRTEPIRLPGPFSHILVGGTVTLEGIAQAASSALPFALAILATGALVAWWDPRGLITLAPRLPIARSVALAAGIAVSTIPAIIDSAHRIRRTLARRGVKLGVRTIIPLLERTLERATGIAVALEARGLRSTTPSPTAAGRPVVVADRFALPTRGLGPVTWRIEPGERIVLTGATGSGKTSLLEAIVGIDNLRGDTPREGRLHVSTDPNGVAFVPHSPHDLFLTSRVIDEVALGLIARGASKEHARSRASEAISGAGLQHLTERDPATLSTGEAAMVVLVATLVTTPQLVVLDEPLSALSEGSHRRYLALLTAYLDAHYASAVVTDHPRHPANLEGWTYVRLSEGELEPGRYVAPATPASRLPYLPPEPEVVLRVRGLRVDYGDTVVLDVVDLDIHRGEICAVIGDNGAGKSSLLEALAEGAAGVTSGEGEALGEMAPPRRVAYLALTPSDPGELFLAASVEEECRLADTASGSTPGLTRLTFESILPRAWKEESMGALHARDLSRGQQTALAIALQLSQKPAVIALDEPMRGLDDQARLLLAEVIACVVETGTAVLIATHHQDSLATLSHRTFRLADATVTQETGMVDS